MRTQDKTPAGDGSKATPPEKFHDPSFLSEYGKIEVLRSIRFRTRFSVILAGLAGNEGNGSTRPSPPKGIMERLAATVAETLRNCDILGMADEASLGAILPDTDFFGALTAVRKLREAATRGPMKGSAPASVLFAHSTFPRDGSTYDELVASANRRLSGKMTSPWETEGLEGKLFWEITEGLLKGRPSDFDNSSFDAGPGHKLSEFFAEQVNAMAVKEIKRAPQRKGVLLITAKRISPELPVLKGLELAGPAASSTKVFIAGEREAGATEIKNASAIYLDDERLKETFFTLFLNEDTSYALICREGWGGALSCFHSSDPSLVEGLFLKFQEEYSQEGLI